MLPSTISREEAKEIALAHIAELDLKGYRYEFAGISSSKNWPDEWGAVFDVYSPSGSLVDGPVVLVIEKNSGRIRGFVG